MAIPVGRLRADQLDHVDRWLRSILWESKLPDTTEADRDRFEIHRSKGRLVLGSGDVKILQGVREVFDVVDCPTEGEEVPALGKIILIGRNVVGVDFEGSFQRTVFGKYVP